MKKKILTLFKYFNGDYPPGRQLQVHDDDTFIVSYPKSGNTWVRFLVANLVHFEEPVSLVRADQLIPTVDGHSRKHFEQMPRPRLIKSHYPFDPNYKRVIYVVRDPKDVALSQYYFQIKRGVLQEGYEVEHFVDLYVAGKTCPYGSWAENVGSWLGARRGDPNFLLLRYEDLLTDPISQLAKVASFLGIAPAVERLRTVVERSSADRMRKLERLESRKWDSTRNTRQDISFVRSAKAGEGQARLPQQSIDKIEANWAGLMLTLNYQVEFGRKSK